LKLVTVLKREEKKIERKLLQIQKGYEKELKQLRAAMKALGHSAVRKLKGKRKMSAAARRRIGVATKKRWAAYRAKKAAVKG
jgi:hypothetical protein